FFFQAEDGIRDYKVTGVQTCALPISGTRARAPCPIGRPDRPAGGAPRRQAPGVGNRALLGARRWRPGRPPAGAPSSRRTPRAAEIGRASCRERVWISVVAVALQ